MSTHASLEDSQAGVLPKLPPHVFMKEEWHLIENKNKSVNRPHFPEEE